MYSLPRILLGLGLFLGAGALFGVVAWRRTAGPQGTPGAKSQGRR